MSKFSNLAISLLVTASFIEHAVAKPTQQCNKLQDECVLEPDAAQRAAKCKTFHDKCEVTLGEKIDHLTDPPKKGADKGGKKVPGGKKGGSGAGGTTITLRYADGRNPDGSPKFSDGRVQGVAAPSDDHPSWWNGKFVTVVMPDGSTLMVKQGAPGGAFIVQDGKAVPLEKVVNGVRYNVSDPSYEVAIAAAKKQRESDRATHGGAVSGAPTRLPSAQQPRGNGPLGAVPAGGSAASGNSGVGTGNSSNATAIPDVLPGTPSNAAHSSAGLTSAKTKPVLGAGTFGGNTSPAIPGAAGAARKLP